MIKNLWLFVALALTCLTICQWSFSSALKRRTGNDLLDMCQYVDKPTRDQDVREKALTLSCLSYASGFMEGVIAGSIAASKDGQPLVCPSEDVTSQQIASVVLKYLREHPEERHEFSDTYRKAVVYVKGKNGQWLNINFQSTKVQPR